MRYRLECGPLDGNQINIPAVVSCIEITYTEMDGIHDEPEDVKLVGYTKATYFVIEYRITPTNPQTEPDDVLGIAVHSEEEAESYREPREEPKP